MYSTSPGIICIHREMMFSVSSTPAIVPESTASRHVEISITLASSRADRINDNARENEIDGEN